MQFHLYENLEKEKLGDRKQISGGHRWEVGVRAWLRRGMRGFSVMTVRCFQDCHLSEVTILQIPAHMQNDA